MAKPPIKIGKYNIGKECSAKWFPSAGRGYWDGIRFFLRKPMYLTPRRFEDGFAVGPLMIWKD
jgi:hypothetical protein